MKFYEFASVIIILIILFNIFIASILSKNIPQEETKPNGSIKWESIGISPKIAELPKKEDLSYPERKIKPRKKNVV